MPDESELSRMGRSFKRAIGMGQKDINLPLEGAAEERKEKMDRNQGAAMRGLAGLASGKVKDRDALLQQMKGK